jgi:hypothetical protein
LIITISDTCKNQPKRLDFDNTINLSSLIVSLAWHKKKAYHGYIFLFELDPEVGVETYRS